MASRHTCTVTNQGEMLSEWQASSIQTSRDIAFYAMSIRTFATVKKKEKTGGKNFRSTVLNFARVFFFFLSNPFEEERTH